MNTTLGTRIKEIRKDMNLTQDVFGEKIGIKKSSLSSVENGTSGISDGVLKNIINEFCVNETWLKDGIGEKYNEKLKKDKEFMQNELHFMTETMLDQQQAFFERIKNYAEDERLEMITALEEIYSILNPPDINEDTYFEYYETVSGMMCEINRYISCFNPDINAPAHVVIKYIDAIKSDLIKIIRLLAPDMYLSMIGDPANIESDISSEDKSILNLYHSLDEKAQEELKELMEFKVNRSSVYKRNKKLSNSMHGEEAAVRENSEKKMA